MRADCGNLLGTTYSVLGTGYSVFSFPRRICLHGNRDYLYFFSFIIMDNKEKIYPPNFKSFPLLPLGFSCGSAGKESACNVGDLDSIPGLGRSPGEGKGYPLQYSGLENSMDCIVHGVAKCWTRLSNFHFLSLQIKQTNLNHHKLSANGTCEQTAASQP